MHSTCKFDGSMLSGGARAGQLVVVVLPCACLLAQKLCVWEGGGVWTSYFEVGFLGVDTWLLVQHF